MKVSAHALGCLPCMAYVACSPIWPLLPVSYTNQSLVAGDLLWVMGEDERDAVGRVGGTSMEWNG